MTPLAAVGWTFEPLQVAPLAIIAGAYALRARTLAQQRRPVRARRQLAFYAGVLVLLLAVASPLDTLGEERLFYVHMAQHLMIGDLAPLLVVLGLTGPLLRPLLALRAVQRLRFLAHPLVALPLWIANLYLWHTTALYQGALAHPALHALQHELFFACGALMWAAVVEPLPGPDWFGNGWKAAYVLVVRTAGGVLGSIFIWSGTVFYGRYASGERIEHVSAHSDQVVGGALMFVEGSIVTVAVFAWLFVRWMREAELRQALLDRGHDERAAARAARYGRRALAREREERTAG